MTAMYAYKHVGSFVAAMSAERYDFAGEYVDQLDESLVASGGAGPRCSTFLKKHGR